MRKIAEIKRDKRLRIVDSGFDGMACYLNDRRLGTRQRELTQPLPNMGRDVFGQGYFLAGR